MKASVIILMGYGSKGITKLVEGVEELCLATKPAENLKGSTEQGDGRSLEGLKLVDGHVAKVGILMEEGLDDLAGLALVLVEVIGTAQGLDALGLLDHLLVVGHVHDEVEEIKLGTDVLLQFCEWNTALI